MEVRLQKKVLIINGVERPFMCDPERETLSDALRRIGLTGVKVGCGTGVCGSCSVILNGKVSETYEDSVHFGFDESDVLYSLSCLGNEYDAVMHSDFSDDVKIKEGNVVFCVYRVLGWPKQNDNSGK